MSRYLNSFHYIQSRPDQRMFKKNGCLYTERCPAKWLQEVIVQTSVQKQEKMERHKKWKANKYEKGSELYIRAIPRLCNRVFIQWGKTHYFTYTFSCYIICNQCIYTHILLITNKDRYDVLIGKNYLDTTNWHLQLQLQDLSKKMCQLQDFRRTCLRANEISTDLQLTLWIRSTGI